jgi:DNA-binding NtrC family response regulator
MLDISLRREGHRVETVQSGQNAKNKIDGALYDVIITDIKMPNIDGIEVLRHAHKISPDSAVILITAVDDYEAAVQAVKAGGASDYIRKSPGLVDEIKLAINRAVEKLAHTRLTESEVRRRTFQGVYEHNEWGKGDGTSKFFSGVGSRGAAAVCVRRGCTPSRWRRWPRTAGAP